MFRGYITWHCNFTPRDKQIWRMEILQRKLLPTFNFNYSKWKKTKFSSRDWLPKIIVSIKDLRSKSTFGKKTYGWKMNHLNKFWTRWLFNNFCYNLIKWWDAICLDINTIEKSVKIKKINGKLNLKVSTPNTDRPIVSRPETQNDLRANKTISRSKSNWYPQIQKHRLQNPKNVMLRRLNVNSLRHKIEAVKELIQSNIDISLFSETKL